MRTLIGVLAGVLLLGGCEVFGGKSAEEPAYSVTLSAPPYEIRTYPPVVVARTVARGPYDDAVETGFGRLFDYITGANTGTREIEMTAPVLTEGAAGAASGAGARAPAEIEMTAPVLTDPQGEGTAVMFVLPEDLTLATAPLPTDPAVTLAEIPARRVAVARFSGFLTEAAIAEARAGLVAWLEAQDLPADGEWQAAGYNPPWTIPALRRNEVLITLPE